MESNHHGCFHPQGPQPCASTSSATAARGRGILDVCVQGEAAGCGCPGGRVLYEQVFEGDLRLFDPADPGAAEIGTTMELDLTKRQKEIFDFIRKYAAKTGYPPTVREIGKAVGLHSSSTVHAHLANLEKIGLLKRDPSKPRAIELLFDKAKQAIRPGNGLPLVGQVAAGEPILAEENIEEYIEIPDVIGGEDGDYILQIRGESMKDAGILESDYVIVRPSDDATDGEIVVALIGEDATVKRYFLEKDHVRLQPENEEMDPILTTEATVIGRVIGVFRSV